MAVNATFRWLYYEAARLCKIHNDPSAILVAKSLANEVVTQIVGMRDWHFLNAVAHIKTVPYQSQYSMPPDCKKIIDVYSIDRNYPLKKMDERIFRKYNYTQSDTSFPYCYIEKGLGIFQDPASLLTLVSSSILDTGEITIYGTSYGREVSENITLNGTTNVSSLYKYNYISKITPVSGGADGDVAVTSFDGNITNCTISSGSTSDVTSFTQPATKVFISSSAGAADVDIEVTIEGIDSTTGLVFAEAGVLNAAGEYESTNNFGKIRGISKNLSTGIVTAVDWNSAVLWRAGANDDTILHQRIEFLDSPSTAETMQIWYKRGANRMVNDYDSLPFDEQDSIVVLHLLMSRLYDWMGHQGDRSVGEMRLYTNLMVEMKDRDNKHRPPWVRSGRGETPVSGTPIGAYIFPYGGYTISS